MTTETKPKAIFSRFVRQGKKSYFLDVYESPDGHRWLAVTQSEQMDDGKYKRNRITLTQDSVEMFAASFKEAAARVPTPNIPA